MILGDETNRKVAALVKGEGFEVVQTSKIQEALGNLTQKKFDVVLIDSLFPKADEACYLVKETTTIPVVLVTNGHQIDWNKYKVLDVDGFLPEKAPKVEFIARIKAIVRGSNNVKVTA